MKNIISYIDFFLDLLKRVLVRFKDNKFGLSFILNIFVLPDFFADKNVNIFSKFRVLFSLALPIIYFVSVIDIVPEILTGVFGYIDDIMVMTFSLGKVNEELHRYKKSIKDNKDPNVIDGVNFHIKDDE